MWKRVSFWWQTGVLLLLILGIGVWLRVYQLPQLPPGDGYDPAYYGVDALEILGGARPIYLTTNFGREALFSYLVALVYLVTGPGAFGIHLTAVLIGILTLPATYLAAREFFRDEPELLAQWGGVVAVAALAVSYWHLNWSRAGVRAVLVPLVAALSLGFFWRGQRTGSRWAYGWCGFFLGVGFYTYQVARLLPVLLVLGFVIYWLPRRRWSWAVLQPLMVVGLTAVFITLPLILYSLNNPGALNERVWQVAVFTNGSGWGERLQATWAQVQRALLMFSVVGDDDPMYTIVGRPALDWLISIPFYLGLAISLWRWRRPKWLLLLMWLGIMLLPAMIADSAAEAKRAIGTLPAIMILIAVGLLWPLNWLQQATPRRPWLRPAWASLVTVVLLISGGITFHDYFVVWGQDPGLAAHFNVQRAAVGQYLAQTPPGHVYLSGMDPAHPTIQLNAGLRPDVVGYDGRRCVPLPGAADAPTTYVVAPDTGDQSLTWLEAIFPQGRLLDEVVNPENGRLLYYAYHVPPSTSPQLQPQHLTEVNWDNQIGLLGYDLAVMEGENGRLLTITLYYQALTDVAGDYTAFVHILTPAGPLLAQSDSKPCGGTLPTNRWQAGEVVRDVVVIPLDNDQLPHLADVSVGFYSWPDLQRLPVLNQAQQPVADHALLQMVVLDDTEMVDDRILLSYNQPNAQQDNRHP